MKWKIIILFMLLIPLVSAYSFTNWELRTYQTDERGIIKVIDYGYTQGYYGFAITGYIAGIPYIKTVNDFIWLWQKYNYTYLHEDYDDNGDLTNFTKYATEFKGYNNYNRFNITQKWTSKEYQATKSKYIISNNLGYDITNVKYWIIYIIPDNFPHRTTTRFNQSNYLVETNNSIHLEGDYTDINPRIRINFNTFNYEDIINNGFEITNIYMGDGEIIGYSNKNIIAIGFTKGLGIFYNGNQIEIDPEDTGFLSPDNAGGQWNNPDNIKVSDNARAVETTIGEMMNMSIFDIEIVPDSLITGIYIALEGFGGPCIG